VIIVTWNSGAVIGDLLRSIRSSDYPGELRTIVVDNDSHDETLETVRRLAPEALIAQTGRNAGYAAGANAGIALAEDCDAYLLLNPDLRVRADSIALLVNELITTGAGIVVPRLVDQDGGLRLSLRREPTVLRAWGESLLGGMRAGRIPALGEIVVRAEQYERPARVAWATGAAMLVSLEATRAVGLWDETYFLYSEETDFALRAADAGYELRFTPNAEIVHFEGESHESSALFSRLTTNRVKLYRSRHGVIPSSAFWLGVFVGEALRVARPTRRAAAAALLGRTNGMAGPTP
jgi:GT2 family glycosyltransferase